MCVGVLDFHCDTTRSRRSASGKFARNVMRRASLGRQLGRTLFMQQASHAASFDICRSTDRKNRGSPAPATLILATSAGEPEVPLLERIFGQRDRVLCLRRLNLVGAHQGSADQALNLGLLFFANVPHAIDLCAMVWSSSPDYGRGVDPPTYRAAIEEFQR
jgi:hypothetical protein